MMMIELLLMLDLGDLERDLLTFLAMSVRALSKRRCISLSLQ